MSRRWRLDSYLVLACLALGSLGSPLDARAQNEGWRTVAGDVSLAGRFDTPRGLAQDAERNLYVADSSNHRVQKLDPDGQPLDEFSVENPTRVAVDAAGNVYVAADRIVKFSPQGDLLAEWLPQEPCPPGCYTTYGPPLDLAIDADGLLQVAFYQTDFDPRSEPRLTLRFATFPTEALPTEPAPVEGQASPSSRSDLQRATTGAIPTRQSGGEPAVAFAIDSQGRRHVVELAPACTRGALQLSAVCAPGSVLLNVRTLSPDGEVLAAWSSPASGPAELRDVAGVGLDAAGNLYVLSALAHRIQVFSPLGEPLGTLGGYGVAAGQFRYPGGLLVDEEGNLIVSDSGNRRVQKLSAGGESLAVWGAAPDGSVQLDTPRGIALDGAGDLLFADSGNHRIMGLSPQGEARGTIGAAVDPPSLFDGPSEATADGLGGLYVADTGNHRILLLTADGQFVAQYGELGVEVGQFRYPSDVSIDDQGNLWVADTGNDRVQKLSALGQPLAVFGSSGSGPGQLDAPTDVAIDPQGVVYVVESGNSRLHLFSPDGQPLMQWSADEASAVRVDRPTDVEVDGDGSVYLAQIGDPAVRKFSSRGEPLGSWGDQSDWGDAPGAGSRVNAIAIDGRGFLYVSDAASRQVLKFSREVGPAIEPIARYGPWPSDPRTAPTISGLAIDDQDGLYLVDSWNDRIERLVPGLNPMTIGPSGPLESELLEPTDVALDASGNRYILDGGRNRVEVRGPDGVLLARWEASPTPTEFGPLPASIAVGPDGTVFVADTANHVVRAFSASGEPRLDWGVQGVSAPDQILDPAGLAVDEQGHLFVGHRFRMVAKLSPSGETLAVWQSAESDPIQIERLVDLAVGLDGSFYLADERNGYVHHLSPVGELLTQWPTPVSTRMGGIAVDPSGVVYVTDQANHRVLALAPQP